MERKNGKNGVGRINIPRFRFDNAPTFPRIDASERRYVNLDDIRARVINLTLGISNNAREGAISQSH